MKLSQLINNKLFILISIFSSLTFSVNCLENNNIISKKVDFIIKIGTIIKYPNESTSEKYRIGFYGKNKDTKALVKEFESRGNDLTIQGKSVELFVFKKTRNVVPVDLIYISGNGKIRIGDLNEKLSKNKCIILTEDFPYGASMLNFTTNADNEIFYEIQEEALKTKGAVIDSGILQSKNRVKSVAAWEQKLESAFVLIHEQEETIEEKTGEIEANEKIISLQRYIILIAIFTLIIITGLVIMLRRSNHRRALILKDIMDSMRYAKYIQNAILPPKTLFEKSFKDFFILFQPKDVISGDFYWMEKVNNKILFAVADCTGHGVPGALLSVLCNDSITKAVKELKIYEPAKILDKAVEYLEESFSKSETDVSDGMDIALCSFNTENRRLEYAGAKSPLYLIQNGELNTVKPDRQSIGKCRNRKPYTNHSFTLKTGDCIYLLSDGYVDQFGGAEDKKYTYKRLKEDLISIYDKPMDTQRKNLSDNLANWMEKTTQIDDISILGLRVC